MNAEAEIYVDDEDAQQGSVLVERPGDTVGIHLQIDGTTVASAFFDTFQLGVLVGHLSAAGVEEVAKA